MVFVLAAHLLAPLGVAGGLILALVRAACVGSFLFLVEQIVRSSHATLDDFTRSFGAYLWDVIGFFFLLWIFHLVVDPLLLSASNGPLLLMLLGLVLFILLNVVPELIYLGHHSSLALVTESYTFVRDNGLEWFPPNLLLGAGLYLLLGLPSPNLAILGVKMALLALSLYFGMIVRGLLFQALDGSSRRSRAFHWKARG